MPNVFEQYDSQAWPYRFHGTITFNDEVRGGTPSDLNKVESWLRSKLDSSTTELQIQQLVAQTMAERGVTEEQAIELAGKLRHLNGFKRDENGLFLEGRQLKAGLKEAAVVALSANKIQNKGFGATSKSLRPFIAEHVMIEEQRLHLYRDGQPIVEPDEVDQRFVHVFGGNGIQYEEVVRNASMDFTLKTDWPFTREEWTMIFLTGGEQGLGATRSMGYGRYHLSRFDQVSGDPIPETGTSAKVKAAPKQ